MELGRALHTILAVFARAKPAWQKNCMICNGRTPLQNCSLYNKCKKIFYRFKESLGYLIFATFRIRIIIEGIIASLSLHCQYRLYRYQKQTFSQHRREPNNNGNGYTYLIRFCFRPTRESTSENLIFSFKPSTNTKHQTYILTMQINNFVVQFLVQAWMIQRKTHHKIRFSISILPYFFLFFTSKLLYLIKIVHKTM